MKRMRWRCRSVEACWMKRDESSDQGGRTHKRVAGAEWLPTLVLGLTIVHTRTTVNHQQLPPPGRKFGTPAKLARGHRRSCRVEEVRWLGLSRGRS
ncbi:hypothetical protein E3N88_32211 [Mikania micrantha]|uniref:Uncharacterized protein n=1 Tax=Mikania micrantha TaxID=192012 RepID=A0A5N6M8C7_9ASTR|nr:hypothetical protein E3N88_32211 [Mikania micrantha]